MNIYELYLDNKSKAEIIQKRALIKEKCEKLWYLIALSNANPAEVINNKENEEILTLQYITGLVKYKNYKMALKYPQYSCFVEDLSYLFDSVPLETIDVSLLDTSNVKDMSYTFLNNSSLREIKGLEYWDTSKVLRAAEMFSHCKQLEKVDISNFNLRNCRSIDGFFARCESLKEIKGLENLGHTKEIWLKFLFLDCSSLERLDLSNWDVTNITEIHCIFRNCKRLKKIKFTGWNLKNIEQIFYMFDGCPVLSLEDCTDERLNECFESRDKE